MQGKYITTSLILAILGNGRNSGIEVAETPATIAGHEIIWSKDAAAEAATKMHIKRDELKKA